MNNIKLTRYIDRIEDEYIKSRSKWEELCKKIDTEQKEYEETDRSLLSEKGQKELDTKHRETRKQLLEEFEGIRKEFEEAAAKIKEDSDKVFDKNYKYSPEDIDQNGITVLKNGNLNIRELIDLAEDYRKSGNNTMYFIVAERLEQNGDYPNLGEKEREAQDYYERAKRIRSTREDHELIDAMMELCLAGLRNTHPLHFKNEYDPSGAVGVHKKHEGIYNQLRELSEEIETEVASPWDD